jgi:hypothetical protein
MSFKEEVAKLAAAVQAKDVKGGLKILQNLKVELLSLDSLPPTNLSTTHHSAQLTLSTIVYCM